MKGKIRWGILSTGSIAKKFAEGLRALPDAELAAVGSRSMETANAFGDQFQVKRRHGSYEALAADPGVDAVYIGTPHPMHKENTILCLKAGKAVLCEKPFAINATQAQEMVRTAREHGVFLMEAMWTRYLPIVVKVREWLSQGLIGDTRMLEADFGFRAGWNEEGRLLNPKLGGGGLLDVGIYNVSLASMVFGGAPTRIAGLAHVGATGVDEQAAMILGYNGGKLAVLSCAVRTNTPQQAVILGEDGRVKIHSPYWNATKATLSIYGKEEKVVELPRVGNGYNYEADEVMRCLREGRKESAVMPLAETVEIMKTMDAIRAQWGLRYPME